MSRNTRRGDIEMAIVLGFFAIVVLALLAFAGFKLIVFFQEADITLTVTEKERIVDRDGQGSRYLIWSEEGEVVENTDSFLKGKWNSSDIYGDIVEGKKYNCRVYGARVPFFSMYRNILHCSEVSNE